MQLLNLVLPIFAVIFLGTALKRMGLFDDAFAVTLNKLVYQIFLPTLIFWEVSRSPFRANFNPNLVLLTYLAMGLVWFSTLLVGRIGRWPPALVGSLTQGAFRGNLAYIGLAVVYSVYGTTALSRAAVLSGFMIPFMNFFSILALTTASRSLPSRRDWGRLAGSITLNPLILASFAGLVFSFFALPLPDMVAGFLRLISGLALPLALISLGGSLTFGGIQFDRRAALAAVLIKLLLLPLVGLLLLRIGRITGLDCRVTLILLACPTAVVTYIMASELGGDADLSAAIIMGSTLLSMITLPAWAWVAGI